LGGLWALEWAWHIAEKTWTAQESQEALTIYGYGSKQFMRSLRDQKLNNEIK